jgi:cytochrome c peroxidase
MKAKILNFTVVVFLAAGLVSTLRFGNDAPAKPDSTGPSVGDVRTLRAVYDRWKATYTRNGGDRKLILALRYSKGLSAQFTRAHGQATLDLVDGSLSVEISGLSDQEAFDVWLIDNRPGPGRSVKPELGDVMVRFGSLKHDRGTATLQGRLAFEALPGFEIDLVVVARAGEGPGAAGLLFGSPSLFQRLYYSEQLGQSSRIAEAPRPPESAGRSLLSAPFQALIPSPAFADGTGGTAALDEALVAEGERVFFNETFNGNGRTCGTCHPAENNFTIDPTFIATLPATDPLFVAENNLDFPDLARNFENPTLMREFGLILENVDLDLGDPKSREELPTKFVMRGVPHVLALSTSRTPAPPSFPRGPLVDGITIPPGDGTGWGGDGAPGSGTLRDFATGAVRQHFTKTLNRVEGVDFRLPTPKELDALEAFQLSLGRNADPDLSKRFRSALAEQGKQLFLGEKGCSFCHSNAGASASIPLQPPVTLTGNLNFTTGVEDIPNHPAGFLPRDGGFGRNSQDPKGTGPFGDGTFNTPPLVEAADTGPFFHNNAVNTIEEAVAFYGTDEFNKSPAALFVPIAMNGEEARAIGAFLRVINALENVRSSIALQERAEDGHRLGKVRELLRLSIAETNDAIKVLSEAGLHPGAVSHLRIARVLVEIASAIPFRQIRSIYIRLAVHEQRLARDRMVED